MVLRSKQVNKLEERYLKVREQNNKFVQIIEILQIREESYILCSWGQDKWEMVR